MTRVVMSKATIALGAMGGEQAGAGILRGRRPRRGRGEAEESDADVANLFVESTWVDEGPTIKRFQPLDGLASNSRMTLAIRTADPAAIARLAETVGGSRGGRGEIVLDAELPRSGHARLVLGRDFILDAELATTVEALPGILEARLSAGETDARPKLAAAS